MTTPTAMSSLAASARPASESRTGGPIAAPHGSRFASVELLRILSMFLIVWFHSRAGGASFHNVAYAGLACFIIMTAFFNLTYDAFDVRRLRKIFIRLAVPWLIWSLIYLLLHSIIGKINLELNPSIIFYALRGPSIHLWYLPFSFLVTVMCFLIFPLKHKATLLAVSSVFMIGWVWTATFWRPWSLSYEPPVPQYVHAIFPCLSGILIYQGIVVGRRLALALVFLSAIALFGMAGLGVTYIIGAGLFIAALLSRNKLDAPHYVFVIAECMFGVYLIHPLIFPVSRVLMGGITWSIPICTFFLATTSVLFIRAWTPPSLRMVFGLAA